ncbi:MULTISPECIES: MBL fold metallo-hydrolase [unclassified Leifsonia]|uniref:MBL fold metallo-hydrolase n=1 Tax=unclassified Leifsonia TaxID=2663824 RepID=UPI0006FA2BA2|nr:MULTISPECIES: MBL fold metallo-hydrolase [unclassified Leifsonia]KQX06969.1 MBL fold metallo-hydrolase [Leifsonia sp. Root1293]KRA11253.1 MBL fold metallo-hydrolase [Leifsonia sp. Root60]
MLKPIAEDVAVHESACIQSNAVVVEGADGVLLVDPGITRSELAVLGGDLRERGRRVIAGFATHPHWDHVLWHPSFGDAPRYGTAACAASLRRLLRTPGWEAEVADGLPPEFADDIPMDLLGLVTAVPAGTALVPWNGPAARVIEHRAHSEGHAALLIENRGVLVAGDMLSDVLVPMLDLAADDPISDYLRALESFERVAGDVDVVVPGHGSVGDADQLRARIEQDRSYVLALRDRQAPDDARIGTAAKPGWEWVRDVHEWQVGQLDRRSTHE